MIPIVEGTKFKIIYSDLIFTVHKVTEDIVEVTNDGELEQYTRKEFDEINNDLTEIK